MRALGDEFVSVEHLLLALDVVPRDALLDALQGGARRAAGHLAGPRGLVPGAREVRPRPHRSRRVGQARPGHRPRRGDPARHPGALAPDEEQPGTHRRAGRGQDGDRRRARSAHRRGRRPRGAQGQARVGARRRRAARRREVPRRVRGAAEGRPRGDPERGRRDRPLHRRAAHDRRRGRGRGRRRRGQPPEADARARRAARGRRDDARRVPQAHREGRGARAALPARLRRAAVGRGHDRDPARPEGALRGAPRRRDPRLRARRRGGALRPLHHRPLPPGQGDRPRRRVGVAAAHGDRLVARRARRGRPARAPARDRARRDGERDRGRARAGRARARRREVGDATSSPPAGRARRSALQRVAEIKRQLDELRMEAEREERAGQPRPRRRDPLRHPAGAREGARRARGAQRGAAW